MAFPDDLTTTLIDVLGTDPMDTAPTDGPNVIGQINTLLRALIAALGANPQGTAADLATRLSTLLDVTQGGTITGPVIMTGASSFLTLAGAPSGTLDAATKAYVDALADALFPGGLTLTAVANRDTIIYNGTGWVNAPSGL